MEDKRTQLVTLLQKKTTESKLEWEIVDGSTVSVPVGNNAIHLSEVAMFSQEEPDYVITIFNSQGTEVERYSDRDLYHLTEETWFPAMQSLYRAARRSAMGADVVIDDILGRLSQ